MNTSTCVSKQTKIYWSVSLVVFLSAIAVLASSLYFLYFPSGYQGGRNPYYDMVIIFNRTTWDLVHLWSGIAFTAAILVHLPLHWRWIKGTANRVFTGIRTGKSTMNKKVRLNILVDVVIILSFLVAAFTGMYFAFFPKHSGTGFLFSDTTWDLIHTWSGVVMTLAALVHFAIHWNWIIKVTPKVVSAPFRKEETAALNEINGIPMPTINK